MISDTLLEMPPSPPLPLTTRPLSPSVKQVRDWFAEVQRRLDAGLDPFQESVGGRPGGDGGGGDGQTKAGASEGPVGPGLGEEDEDVGEEDDGEETDDSEVWEPSRSVRKSLSVSED